MEETPLRLRPKQKKEKVLQTCEDNTLREEQTAKSWAQGDKNFGLDVKTRSDQET